MTANVVLIGYTCAGKTTVGARVAQRLGRPHLDVDAIIEQRLGPVAAFIERHGMPAFRTAERAFLREHLPPSGAVISAGAGTVLPPGTRALLCNGARVFFLDVSPAVLAARLAALPADQVHRPDLLRGNTAAAITAELDQRRGLYEALGVRIDASPAPDAVAAEVLRHLGA